MACSPCNTEIIQVLLCSRKDKVIYKKANTYRHDCKENDKFYILWQNFQISSLVFNSVPLKVWMKSLSISLKPGLSLCCTNVLPTVPILLLNGPLWLFLFTERVPL